MTLEDGFRSVLALPFPMSLLSILSGEGRFSSELTFVAFGCFVDFMEPRMPVGIGIFASVV